MDDVVLGKSIDTAMGSCNLYKAIDRHRNCLEDVGKDLCRELQNPNEQIAALEAREKMVIKAMQRGTELYEASHRQTVSLPSYDKMACWLIEQVATLTTENQRQEEEIGRLRRNISPERLAKIDSLKQEEQYWESRRKRCLFRDTV